MIPPLLHAVPADPPTNLQVVILNATSVDLGWSPPLVPYGVIVSYTIQVEPLLVGGANTTTTTTTTIIVSALTGTNYTVENLSPYTLYNFSVAASTRVGTGPSDSVSAQTPQSSKFGSACYRKKSGFLNDALVKEQPVYS